jgi:hypothetical protein
MVDLKIMELREHIQIQGLELKQLNYWVNLVVIFLFVMNKNLLRAENYFDKNCYLKVVWLHLNVK